MIFGESSESKDATGLWKVSRISSYYPLTSHLPSTITAELASDRVARRRIAVSVAFQRTFGVIDCDLGLVEHVDD